MGKIIKKKNGENPKESSLDERLKRFKGKTEEPGKEIKLEKEDKGLSSEKTIKEKREKISLSERLKGFKEDPEEKKKREEQRKINWAEFKAGSLEALKGIGIGILIVLLLFSVINVFFLGKRVFSLTENIGLIVDIQGTIIDKVKALESNQSSDTTKTADVSSVQVQSIVIEPGFNPDPNLIDISKEVNLPKIPEDSILFEDYRVFPDVEGVWGKARAGFNDWFNDEFSSSDRRRNVQIPTFKWLAFTGEEGWWPGIGSLKDPDGGEILLVVINCWEEPGEFLMAYLLHGFWAFGEVWDMSDMLESPDRYGDYTLETMATIRNHFLNQTSSTEPNPEFRGHTGKVTQAETVTWVCVLRWYDGSFRLVNSGQWIRGQ